MRLDKWLWAARFFRTRALAQAAIEAGRVTQDGARLKPSRLLKAEDRLELRIGDARWAIRVLQLSERRGPAEVARTLYEESEESRGARNAAAEAKRLSGIEVLRGEGRPTKRDRRRLDQFREG
jgi:ribosome-associated heat shock protein Hsp15